MPKFLVTAPDGSKYKVTAPEGASQEQALTYFRQQYDAGQRAPEAAGLVGQRAWQDDRGEFTKGLSRGTDNMQGMTYGFAALLGDSIGHEGLAEWGLEGYRRNQQEAAQSAARVGSYREIEGVGDFFDYAAGVLGETAPFALTTIVGGGVGGMLTRAVAPRLLAKKIGEEATKKAVQRLLKDETKKAALNKIVKRGVTAGAFAGSATTQQGGLYAELKEAGVDDAVLPAWAYGAAMGALDVLPELMLADKLLNPKTVSKELSKSFTRGLVGEVAKTGGKQLVAEGVTEGMQEALALHARLVSDEAFDWDDKANERILDAIVAGSVAGLFMGSAGGGISALTAKRPEKKDVPKKPAEAVVAPPPPATAGSAPAAATPVNQPVQPGAAAPVPAEPAAATAAAPAQEVAAAPVTDAPSAEPLRDLTAQFRDARAEGTPRRGVYASAPSIEAHSIERLRAMAGGVKGEPKLVEIENADGKGGSLFATLRDAQEFNQRRQAGEDPEALLGEFTGASAAAPTATKPETSAPVVVQRQVDGAPVQETVAAPETAPQVAETMATQGPGEIVTTTPEDVVARREEAMEGQATDQLSARREAKQRAKLIADVERITENISDDDLNTLQTDQLSSADFQSRIPAALREAYNEWLGEYGAVERETMRAPENRAETEQRFLEEQANDGDAMAAHILRGGGVREVGETDPPLTDEIAALDREIQQAIDDSRMAGHIAGLKRLRAELQAEARERAGGAPAAYYHGTRAPVEQLIDANGNLVLRRSENFGGKTNSVSLSSSLEEASDYATRVKGEGKSRQYDGAVVIRINAGAAATAQRETDTEYSINDQDLVVPKGQFEVIPVKSDVPAQLAAMERDAIAAYADKPLKALVTALQQATIAAEVAENERGNEDPTARAANEATAQGMLRYGRHGSGLHEIGALAALKAMWQARGASALRAELAASPPTIADGWSASAETWWGTPEEMLNEALARFEAERAAPASAVAESGLFSQLSPEHLAAWLNARGAAILDQTEDSESALRTRTQFLSWILSDAPTKEQKKVYKDWKNSTRLDLSMSPAEDSLLRQITEELPGVYREKVLAWIGAKRDRMTEILRAKQARSWPLERVVYRVLELALDRGSADVYREAKVAEKLRNERNALKRRAALAVFEPQDEEQVAANQLTGWEVDRPAFSIGKGMNSDDGVIHGQRQVRRGGTGPIQAAPWVGEDAEDRAINAASLRQLQDPDATYVAEKLTKEQAKQLDLPAAGWWVLAYPHVSGDLLYSKTAGGQRTPAALTRLRIANARNRWERIPRHLKEDADPRAPVLGLHVTLYQDGEIVGTDMLVAEEIVHLGFDLEPSLRNRKDVSLKHRTLDALHVGITALMDFNDRGKRMRVTALEPGANGLPRNLVLRQANPKKFVEQITLGNVVGRQKTVASGLYTSASARSRTRADVAAAELPRELERLKRQLRTVEEQLDGLSRQGDYVPMHLIEQRRHLEAMISETNTAIRSRAAAAMQHTPAFDRAGTPIATVMDPVVGDEVVPFQIDDQGNAVEATQEQTPDVREFEEEERQNRRSTSEIDPGDSIGGSQRRERSAMGVAPGNAAPTALGQATSQSPTQTPIGPGVVVNMETSTTAEAVHSITTTLRDLLQISDQLLVAGSRETAFALARAHGFDVNRTERAWNRMANRDAGGVVVHADGKHLIILNPARPLESSFKTLGHEIGHVFFRREYDAAPAELRAKLEAEYQRFAQANPKLILESVRRGQLYDIHEWMADQVAAWVYTDKTPRSAIEKFFASLATSLRQIYEYMLGRGYRLNDTAAEFIRTTIGAPSAATNTLADAVAELEQATTPAPRAAADSTRTLRGFTNHSGGAAGADTAWTEIGAEFGVRTANYSFRGHNMGTAQGRVELTAAQLAEADERLREANTSLGRRFPATSEYVNNLLRRNWFQVKNADAVFAVSTLADDGAVNGGTGWAVQMAIDAGKPVHVFDQKAGKWFAYVPHDDSWTQEATPALTPNFAGIGTRELTPAGRQAIRDAYASTTQEQRSGDASRLDPAFDSLGFANDTSFDMNVEPREQPSWQKKAWEQFRALKVKYPTVGKMADFIGESMLGLHNVVLARVFKRVERMAPDPNHPFRKIMRHFYKGVGEDLSGSEDGAASFYSDRDGRLQAFSTRFRQIIDKLEEGEKNEILLEAMRERPINPNWKFADQLVDMRLLFNEIHAYMVEAGLPVTKVIDYFPQVYDKDAIATPEAFKDIKAQLDKDGVINFVTGQPYTEAEVQSILQDGMLNDSFAIDFTPDAQLDPQGTDAPFVQAMRVRRFPEAFRNSIRSILDTNGKPKYMTKSLDYVFATYVQQAVTRAEYNRRLGDTTWMERLASWEALDAEAQEKFPRPVFDPQFKLKLLLDDAARNWKAGTDELSFMNDVMAAMLGQYQRIENPAVRKLTNGMMLYQNMRTLLFVVLASFPDVANVFIRTGEFKDTFRVMRATAKAAFKGEYNDALRMYGHAADSFDSTIMREMMDLRDSDSKVWKLNEQWFRAIGLHRWTNFVRGMGLNVSQDYIVKHAERVLDGHPDAADSQRRLDELGVSAQEVQAWAEHKKSYFAPNAPQDEATRKVTAAIQRLVNDMVIHPTPPEKTLWGNSEVMKLFWHLKSFMYGFTTRVLGRVYHEFARKGATTQQRMVTAGALMLLLPLAAFGLALRDLLQYWLWGRESYTPYDDPLGYLGVLAGRSGVTGTGQMAVDLWQAGDRGRAPMLALTGPTVTWMNDWMEYPLYKTVPSSIPVLSSLPGARDIVRDWIKAEE